MRAQVPFKCIVTPTILTYIKFQNRSQPPLPPQSIFGGIEYISCIGVEEVQFEGRFYVSSFIATYTAWVVWEDSCLLEELANNRYQCRNNSNKVCSSHTVYNHPNSLFIFACTGNAM